MMKAAMLAALVVVALAAPLASEGEDLSIKLPPFSKVQLKNGITLLLMEQHETPIVSLTFVIKAGSEMDPSGKEGLAALTAELLRKGAASRTSEQIATELAFMGGAFDINVALDSTEGSAEFLKKDIAEGLDIVSDIILAPAFPEDEVRKVIEQSIDDTKSLKDQPGRVIDRYFSNYLYGEHPYARPVSGDERSVAAITRDDIRDFYNRHYFPANTIIAIAGDFQTKEMHALIESRFSSWTLERAPSRQVEPPSPVKGRRLLLIDKPDATQTYFDIGNVGISRTNPDRVAIRVVNTLFGGRFTSRLNTLLRVDSGLTYGARASFEQHRLAGPFRISSFTRNAATERTIDLTLRALETFREKGVTDDELRSAKAYLKGQFPTSIESSDQLAATIARLELYGLDEGDINSYFAKIDQVTATDARRIIKQYFPLDDLVFVLIGKASEIQTTVKKYAPQIEIKSISEPGF